MKHIFTMSIALFLCAALFFILKPLASNQPLEEHEPGEMYAKKESKVTSKYIDKIAEFPILPQQSKRLQLLQLQRQKSIQGMDPSHIKIPSIGVDTNIQPTEVLENGEMGVPDDVNAVGWFEPGYKIGEKGHAVLAGHVDSLTGPAIFYELKKVKAGDKITLLDSSEREMIFVVKKIASYKTDKAPIEEIFGKSDKRMINLITCTGVFNRDIGSHEERLVVSAELLSDSSVKEEIPEPPSNVKETAFNISWHAVRDDSIIGYRIYEKDKTTGKMKKFATVSLFDRKKVEIQSNEKKQYFVTSVNVDLQESEKIEAK